MLRDRLRLAAFVLALVAATLGLAEIALRRVFARPDFARSLQGTGPTGDRIAMLACYAQVRAGSRACLPFADLTKRIDPDLGWTNQPGAIPLGNVVEHINPQGMRAAREIARDKPPGVMRVAIFGDSFAFGSEAADDATFAAVLAKELSGWEVLNFGVPGYGPDQMLLRFRAEGVAFHPDVVVMGLVSLMLQRVDGFASWYKPYFTQRGDALVLHGLPVPTLDEALDRPRESALVDLVRMARESIHRESDKALSIAILRRFATEIADAHARPVLVLYPYQKEYESGSSARRVFQAVCTQVGVDCIDTGPAFAGAFARGVALTSGAHWSPAGHRIVADAILAKLRAGQSTALP